MSSHYAESNYENAVIELLSEQLGYEHVYGPDVLRNYLSPLYEAVLEESLARINSSLPQEAINEAIRLIKDVDNGGGSLLNRNMRFMDFLQSGISVRYTYKGENRSTIVYLIDYDNVDNNDFKVVNQWTIVERSEKRADIIIFVNGLPLVVIELKSPAREETDVSEAYRQIRNYMHEIPSLFTYNAICVMSDMTTSKAGTISSGEDRFMEWKTKDGSYENTQYAKFDTFFEGIFEKNRFLDILQNFICFNEDGKDTFKILAGYHQYFAVKKAVESTRIAAKTDHKGGVFWHTQGSGKSLSMVFYAHYLQKALKSPTIVVITDRNDLDNQLFGQFSRCKHFLRQTPVQAQSQTDLVDLLAQRQANGIIFTTMQKFMESDEPLSDRDNIVVMADEAHRGQYGLSEKVVTSRNSEGELVAKTRIGTARIIRDNLPNATYIGFTGTPISSKDRNTQEVFGNYIDVYDMTQAVEDGATRPVYYESRVIHLKLDSETLRQIDEEYDFLAQNSDPYVIEKSKKKLGQMEAILGADQTIDSLVDDILDHYDNYRSHILTGKAMIVAYSRPIAMKIYKRIMQLRPHWKEKVDVVMTQSNKDPEEWRQIIGNKSDKDNKARSFKDNKSKFKIAIVVDMWLTGFDVPSLATMYVFKPMVGHNLMQAIARVNRVFQDKEGGLVVDYIGIAKALKEAMNEYTSRDKSNYGNLNIKEVAYPKFLEKLEICQDIFHGYNYSPFISGSDLKRAKIITGGVNFLLEKNILEHNFSEERKSQNAFIKEALLLKQALSLCGTLASEEERLKAAFFEAVRTMIVRITMGGTNKKFSLNEINERINELLKQSIKSEGVINLFSDSKKGFSLFDPKFLDEIAKMKEKNLAIELLKKLIADQVANYRRTNLVKSKKFSELIQETMNRYINGMITNEEVIDQLVKLAHEIKKAIDQGNELGLTPIELAFYDALTQPQACKDFYHNDELIALTRELTDTLRKNRTVDWTQKSTARAGMRMMVKKLLKKYKYPPEGQEEALDTVIKQCELWADNNSDDFSQIRADIDRDDDDLETNLVATPPVPHNL